MRFLSFLVGLLLILTAAHVVLADEYDDITKQLNDLKKSLSASQSATATNEKELTRLQTQLTAIKTKVAGLEQEIVRKQQEVRAGEENLAYQKTLLDERAVTYYKSLSKNAYGVVEILVAENIGESLQNFFYQKSLQDEDRRTITRIVLYIKGLEEKKAALESEKLKLDVVKAEVDKQSQFLAGEVAKSKKYEGELSQKIAVLSAKQQEILNAKSGSFTFSLGNDELSDEYLSSIKGFRESAPGGYYAIFSFGGYTHRNGMSQYGALGRFLKGKSPDAESILKFYYPNATLKKDYSSPSNITIDGVGERAFEDQYMKGIFEIPNSWPKEVQKAQAIAARTYAIRYTNNGTKSICSNEGCQVFKDQNKGGTWEEAVNETKGWVLVDGGGNLVSTQYSSTAGGWSNTSGWDTEDGSGGSNFIDKSYEKHGGSPWLYKAWWRERYSNSGATCGLSNPWLSPVEMADIVNAAMVMTRGGSGADTGRVTPVTTSCWGGNPYSHEELRSVSESYGGGVGSVSSVTVLQGNGNTNEVVFQTDKGEKRLNAADFKKGVSLRAPGYIRIPQDGFAFFNIEKK